MITAFVAVVGVFLNFVVPENAFEIVLNIGALGTMAGWAAITLSHMKFLKLAKKPGQVRAPRLPCPFTGE